MEPKRLPGPEQGSGAKRHVVLVSRCCDWTGANDTASTAETLYGYDNQGRLASVTTAREENSALSGGSVTTRRDAEGDAMSTSLPTTLYLYDGDGNLTSQVNPNNTETDYDYIHYWDVGGGEEIVANKRTSDSTTLSQFTYTFDANRNKISELDQMTDAGEGASNSQLYTWAYDADGRLTDETFDNQNDGSGGANIVSTDDYHARPKWTPATGPQAFVERPHVSKMPSKWPLQSISKAIQFAFTR